jgi:hypothetical protein
MMRKFILILSLVLAVLSQGISPASASLKLVGKRDQEAEFLRLIKGFRANLGLSTLTVDARLQAAAEKHSQDMFDHQLLTHFGPALGETSGDRMIAEGAPCFYCGENIASGNTGAKRTFLQWVFSTPHLLGMITPNYDHVGVSRVGFFWTTDFAQLDETANFENARQPSREAVVYAVETMVGPLGERAKDISLIENESDLPNSVPAPLPPSTAQNEDQNPSSAALDPTPQNGNDDGDADDDSSADDSAQPSVENPEDGSRGTQVTQMAQDALDNAKAAVSEGADHVSRWFHGLGL